MNKWGYTQFFHGKHDDLPIHEKHYNLLNCAVENIMIYLWKNDDLLNFAMENMMIYLWKKWSSAKLFHGKHDDLPMKDEYLLNVAMGKNNVPMKQMTIHEFLPWKNIMIYLWKMMVYWILRRKNWWFTYEQMMIYSILRWKTWFTNEKRMIY